MRSGPQLHGVLDQVVPRHPGQPHHHPDQGVLPHQDLNLLMIFLTIHHMITISSTDGGLSRRPSHPLDPLRASLTLWNLLLCCGECPWTGNFLRDKDEELRLRQTK